MSIKIKNVKPRKKTPLRKSGFVRDKTTDAQTTARFHRPSVFTTVHPALHSAATPLKMQHAFEEMPRSYRELCLIYLPRPIHNAREYAEAERMAGRMAGFEGKMSKDQNDYFDAITTFMEAYETTDIPRISGVEILRSLMEEHDLSGASMAKILKVDRSVPSRILGGERSITAEHARALGQYFHVDPGVFIVE